MQLSQDAIRDFKRIYQEQFGELLSDHAAQTKGLELLRLFDLLSHRNVGDTDGPHEEPARPFDVPGGTVRIGDPS
jgi:hypothetical protein